MQVRNIIKCAAYAAVLLFFLCPVLAVAQQSGETSNDNASKFVPKKDATIVVPFGAGGGSDAMARTLVKVIDDLGLVPVDITVENRPGGSGAIGYHYIAQQKGDPYTLGTVSVSFFTTPLLGSSPVNYKDFTPVAAMALSPYILVVRSDSEIQSMEDIISGERFTTSSVGVVSDAALLAHMVETQTGVEIDVVPYNGEGAALASLLGDHIDFMFSNPAEVLAQLKAGKLRPIAVTTKKRLPSFPDVPTLQEVGLDITHVQLRGMVLPSGVSEAATEYWENVFRKVAMSEEWETQYLEKFHVQPYFAGSDEFRQIMEETNALYKRMMKKLNIIE